MKCTYCSNSIIDSEERKIKTKLIENEVYVLCIQCDNWIKLQQLY